jgi:hypothetical protein
MSGELHIPVGLFPGTDPGTLWLVDWGGGGLKSQSERSAVVKIQVSTPDGS